MKERFHPMKTIAEKIIMIIWHIVEHLTQSPDDNAAKIMRKLERIYIYKI